MLGRNACWSHLLGSAMNCLPMQVWPNKGLHYAMMSKIAALLEQDDVAAESAATALQQLQNTHANSPILESVRQIHFESRQCLEATS